MEDTYFIFTMPTTCLRIAPSALYIPQPVAVAGGQVKQTTATSRYEGRNKHTWLAVFGAQAAWAANKLPLKGGARQRRNAVKTSTHIDLFERGVHHHARRAESRSRRTMFPTAMLLCFVPHAVRGAPHLWYWDPTVMPRRPHS